MGKSDPHVFNFWAQTLFSLGHSHEDEPPDRRHSAHTADTVPGMKDLAECMASKSSVLFSKLAPYKSVGFFGQPGVNDFSDWIESDKKHFFDLQLNNWEINSFPYDTDERFDLIICTRCAYFSKHPVKILEEFRRLLMPGGIILIDWAIGDHWRFDEFAVGWKHHGYHESAYHDKNFLWSCYISEKMKHNEVYKAFENNCHKFGYNDVTSAIYDEVPVIVTPSDIDNIGLNIDKETYMMLWPDIPAFYTLLVLSDKDK